MIVRPIELRDANAFVDRHHRHHKPDTGHRFSLSAWDGDRLCGVAIVGRPKAKSYDKLKVLEVTRLCTDGTRNACSALYAAAARAGRAMGYERIQTYILKHENGASLKASGWVCEGECGGGEWKHTGYNRGLFPGWNRNTDAQPQCKKTRWAKQLRAAMGE